MAVNITATRTSTLFTDQDSDGVFDPGDVILTKIRITNSGTTDATGVSVTDTLAGVDLVPGSVQVTPIAFDDLMPSITGNTPITFTAAQLLGNDVDPDGAEINLTITGVSGATNGAIVNNGDGTFTFTPTTGYVGTASFQYTVTDEQGLASVTTGIVSFNVTDPVWYVNNATGSDATGDGSYSNPFATLAPLSTGGSADALDNADDTIFVYNAGTYTNASIVLETGQKLFGDGHAFTVNGLTIGANASNTTLGHAGTAVTLSTNNTIMGVTLNGTANGAIGIDDGGNNVGTLNIDETSITGSGKAIDIDQGGTLNVDLDQLSSTSSTTEGVHLQGVTGTFNAATGTIQTSTGTGILIGAAGGGTASSGGDVNFTYGGDVTSPGGSLVEIQDRTGGTVDFNGSLTEGNLGAGQTGILIDGSAGTINFDGQTFVSAGGGAGNGVTLTNNSGTINFNATGTGLDITTAGGTGLTFTGGGTLNITGAANSVTTTTGQVLNLSGTMGTSGIAFQTLSSGTVAAGNAININNLDAAGAGTFSGGAVTIVGTGGAGADGISISGGSNSTFNFASATIGGGAAGTNPIAGDAIELNGANGSVTFTTVNLQGSAGVGVNIVNATNAVTISGGTIGTTNDPGGDGVNINGGTGAVTVAAAITKTSGGNEAVDISNHATGAIQFSGTINSNSGGGGIRIVNNSSGNIDFTGDVTLNTGTLNAVTFTNTGGTGASVTFSEGSLDIDTTSGTGINATNSTIGAGSLTISGATGVGNIISSTTGRAINIDGVTANITLNEVNVSGGGTTTGVFLKNTGATGQFVVTGDGSTAGSGGTITNIGGGDLGVDGFGRATLAATTGTGIYMENVSNVSISNMIFGQNAGTMNNFAIRGENVNNFTLRDSEFRGTFGTNEGQDEGTIRFGTENNTTVTGLRGTALFEGNNIQGGYENNLSVFLYGANTLNMTVQDSANDQAVFGNNHVNFGDDSLHVESGSTSNLTLTVNGVAFNGARADQLQVLAIGNTTQTMTITNNQFLNGHSNIVAGGGGVTLLGGDTAAGSNVNLTYNFSNNTIKGAKGDALRAIYTGTAGTISGVIANNTIGTDNNLLDINANGGSIAGGAGINVGSVRSAGSGSLTHAVRIQGNGVRDIENAFGGIILTSNMQGTTGTSRLEATILNNIVEEVGTNVLAGLYAIVGGQSSAAVSNDAAKMGLSISGNTFTSGTNGGSAILFDQLSGNAQYYFPGYTVNANSSHGEFRPSGGGGTASSALDAFLDPGNVLNSGPFSSVPPNDVDANQTTNIGNQAFVLTVPIMAGPTAGVGWEDLLDTIVTTPTGDTGSGTTGDSGSTGGTGGTGSTGGTGGTGDTGGTGTGGTGDTGGTGTPSTPVVNDNVLSQAELAFLVEAAIQRWIDAGATAAQVAAMRAVQVGIVDMAGIHVGASSAGVISIDNDAAGRGWFVDSTPGDDSEYNGTGTRLTADAGGAAAGKLDLLTVLMHELGHQIGLADEYVTSEGDDLMFGYINAGERRLPADGEAAGATPGSIGSTAYALTPVSIGTLPSNKTVDVFFKSTIQAQTDGFIVDLDNDSTISGTNFSDVTASEQNVLDSLTLGNTVFLDANKNGVFDAGEGLMGVSVSLYVDSNDSGGWDTGDLLLATQNTLAGGLYSFTGMAPGDYIVVVNASNFGSGQLLEGKLSTAGGTDPDDNVNDDDNGIAGVPDLGDGIASQTITLAYNSEPDGTPDIDGDADADTNLSLDFGFFSPNAAPDLDNVDGNSASFIEGGAIALLDVLSDAALSDDQANFNGGTLTVHIGTGLETGEDELVIDPASTVTVNGSNQVLVGATIIGTVSGGGAGGGDLVFTFNSSATPALVQTLIRALGYNNSNTIHPSTDTRSISITLVDGGGTDGGAGADTTVVNVLVNVTGVNDEPSGAATASDTTNDTTTLIFDENDFNGSFSDQDGHSFAGIVISTLPGTGTLQLNGTDITAGDLPVTVTLLELQGGDLTFVPAAATGGTSVTFDFAVYDSGGVLNGGVDTDQTPGTFTINITLSNQLPVVDLDADDSVAAGTGFASAYTEGGAAAAISDTDVDITDADVGDDIVSATITITDPETGDKLNVGTLPATITVDPSSTDTMVKLIAGGGATVADMEAAIEAITYSNTGNDPTDKGTNNDRSITVTVNDGSNEGLAATATVAVTDVNDGPSGTSSTITATEDVFRLLKRTDLGFVDDDGDLASVTISAVTGGKIYYDADGAGGNDPVEETLPKTYTALDLLNDKVLFKANPNLNGNGVATITFAVTDDDGATDGSPNVLTVNVTAVDDAPVAQPDAISTPENVVGTGSLFANNGSGVDADVDGDPLTISSVTGGTLGVPFMLASGAMLTVNSNGTYSYNPNGKFNKLTDNTSGAVNTSTVGDTFQYTLTGGNTVTVTVTVNGVASLPAGNVPVDWLMGNATDNTINGTALTDQFVLSQGGDDTANGNAGKDFFYFGGALTAADKVNGGADGDTIVLQGDYSGGLILDGDVTAIEGISFLAGTNTAFGDPGTNLYDYVITTADSNFAAGLQVKINGSALLAGEDLTFNGSDETNASFVINGGRGTDLLTGGSLHDIFFFAEGGRFAAGDKVNGGDGYDGLFLRGNYTIDFTQPGYAGVIQNLENITLSSATDERYGRGGGSEFDYDVTWADGLLGLGQTITISGVLLQANETMVFDGALESDGNFRILAGAANDTLIGGNGADLILGGLGADQLTGGGGNDVFRYDSTAESTSASRDDILDFALGDKVDLSKIDANSGVAGNQAFTFIGNAAFSNTAGELRFEHVSGNTWLVQGDTDGIGGADFEVQLVINDLHPITSLDFVL